MHAISILSFISYTPHHGFHKLGESLIRILPGGVFNQLLGSLANSAWTSWGGGGGRCWVCWGGVVVLVIEFTVLWCKRYSALKESSISNQQCSWWHLDGILAVRTKLQWHFHIYCITWLWVSTRLLETALECLAKDKLNSNTAWYNCPPGVRSLQPGHTELESWERRSFCEQEWCPLSSIQITIVLVITHLWHISILK